jgi:fatty-acid desaturase
VLLFKVILPGRVLLTLMTGLAGTFGHMKHFPLSYRNQDTPDTTSNSLLPHYLFLGLFAGMLQNNHHAYPRAEAPNPRRFELDTSWPLVRLLRLLLERRLPASP